MDKQELKTLILDALSNIAPEIETDKVPDDEDLREALELDSMDFLNLIIAVSKQTKIVIPEADYAKVLTLDNMIRYLHHATN